jgi:trimethylamine--corrinoid protein Co-methyltransferase
MGKPTLEIKLNMGRQAAVGCQYQPLSESDIRDIHEASLKILAETGIQVPNSTALEIFRQAGANLEGERVRLSRSLVEDGLASVPHEVLLAGKDPDQDLLLTGYKVHFGTGGSPSFILPAGTNETRQATIQDVADLAWLAESLNEVDFFVLPVTPSDLPLPAMAVNRFYAALKNTRKHIMGGLINLDGAREVFELGSLLAGSAEALRQRPFISCMTSWMISPLTFDPHVTDILTFWSGQGMPVALSSAPMAGSTSPITLAGTLVQLNAEQLAGISYTQFVRRGTPILAGYIPGQMNLYTGGYLGGTVEFALMQAGASQLARFYEVPIYCSAGMTDAKIPDQQAGYEKMLTLLLTALSGASFIHHAVGMLENMNIVSYEQMVLDNDIVQMVKRVLRGIETSPAHMAVEVIQRVGPGGHYLEDEHTLAFMRQEYVNPRLSDRQNREAWKESGGLDSRARAARLVEKLLNAERPTLLDAELDQMVREKYEIHLPT